MKLLLIGAAVAATLLTALPATAQIVVRTPGVGVVVGDGHRDYRRNRVVRRHRAECRTVRTRTRLPNGNVIVKTRTVC